MKYVLALAAMFAALPTVGFAADLSSFGLGDVEVISDAEGQNVRGLGMFSRSTSASGISMNVIDPNTGSQWNNFSTAFNTSDDTKTTTDVSSNLNSIGVGAETNALAQLADIDVTVSNAVGVDITTFTFGTTGNAAMSAGKAIGGSQAGFLFAPTFSMPPFAP